MSKQRKGDDGCEIAVGAETNQVSCNHAHAHAHVHHDPILATAQLTSNARNSLLPALSHPPFKLHVLSLLTCRNTTYLVIFSEILALGRDC